MVMIMSLQAFVGREPREELVQPITNRMFIKPNGGIWTSSYNEEYGSDWIRWMHNEQFYNNGYEDIYLLKPRDDAKIYTIDSYEDLKALVDKYPPIVHMLGTFLDFEAISNDYDGIHLTAKGESATRLTSGISLYGWDVECTLWFRWCFESVEKLDYNIHDFAPIDVDIEDGEDKYVKVDYITFRQCVYTIEAVTDGSLPYDYFGFPGCLDYEYEAYMKPYSPLTKEEARSRL